VTNIDVPRPASRGPVGRTTLHEDLVARLTEMIQEGELPPGSRIAEVALCEQFGVSRTPLREAMKVLAADGLLVSRPNYGAWVSRVDIDEVRQIFETLGGLEQLIGTLLVDRIMPDELAQLEALHSEFVRLHAIDDRVGYFRVNQMIHLAMASAVHNQSLHDVYDALSKKIYRARTMANYSHDRWDESTREHEDIMAAVRAGDGELLAERLTSHNMATCRAVLASLEKVQLDDAKR
jgi:DNA-binding GntR family transcriptional regulator